MISREFRVGFYLYFIEWRVESCGSLVVSWLDLPKSSFENQNFPTTKASKTTGTTTVVGTYVKFAHFVTDLFSSKGTNILATFRNPILKSTQLVNISKNYAVNLMISVGVYVLTVIN